MAKFDKAGSSKSFSAVGKKSAEKAQVITIQNIANENLVDNPENGEDVSFTTDLELSIKENGFTDPLEVTDFGQSEGKYMILSGHRRRCAGVKTGINLFPCLVRHFDSELRVKNYLLSSNAQRDSARDPFLFSKRYKMHEQYLKDSGFTGKIRDEVAKRLGLSVQQADRYNAMNKIILPVWDMVRADLVGISSVQPMAAHPEYEQTEIYMIMHEALSKGVELTRYTVKMLIDGYRKGYKSWDDIVNDKDSSLSAEAKDEERQNKKEVVPGNYYNENDEDNNRIGEKEQEEREQTEGEENPFPVTVKAEEKDNIINTMDMGKFYGKMEELYGMKLSEPEKDYILKGIRLFLKINNLDHILDKED